MSAIILYVMTYVRYVWRIMNSLRQFIYVELNKKKNNDIELTLNSLVK